MLIPFATLVFTLSIFSDIIGKKERKKENQSQTISSFLFVRKMSNTNMPIWKYLWDIYPVNNLMLKQSWCKIVKIGFSFTWSTHTYSTRRASSCNIHKLLTYRTLLIELSTQQNRRHCNEEEDEEQHNQGECVPITRLRKTHMRTSQKRH